MTFFKQLLLEDFQSHKKTVLDLNAGFNAIVGPSNVGKTALTRALAFILYGEWDKSWVRFGAKFARITLTLNNDVVVVREKGEKVNKYILRVPGKPEQVYESFGTEIPEDIKKELKVYKAQIDANEFLNLNFASQLDPLFLLSKPGSFKAKVIGKLSSAHFLDYALRELNKDKRTLSSEKSFKESEVATLNNQLKEFSGLEAEQARLEFLKAEIASLEAKAIRIERIESLFLRAQDWKAQYIAECDKEATLAKVNVPSIDSMETLANRIKRLSALNDNLIQIEAKAIKLNQDQLRVNGNLVEAQKGHETILSQLKICPTCGTSL